MVAANTSLTKEDYVTILKCKQSELSAAETCNLTTVVPLFEVVEPSRSAVSIHRAWPLPKGVVWLHCFSLEAEDDTGFATDVEDLFVHLRTGALAVPVVTPEETQPMLNAIRNVVATDQRGLVIRVDVRDLLDPNGSAAGDIASTASACGVAPADVDLIVDAGVVEESQPPVLAAVVGQALSAVPNAASWRSLVLALSAFPQAVYTVVSTNSVGSIPRNDAAAFSIAQNAYHERTISYADYSLGTPEYVHFPYAPVPSIKYATDGAWMVHRAATKSNPGPQYRQLAADVAAAPYFSAASFSPGDQYIADVANGLDGPGSAMTYLRAGISHHVHTVADRLATLGVP